MVVRESKADGMCMIDCLVEATSVEAMRKQQKLVHMASCGIIISQQSTRGHKSILWDWAKAEKILKSGQTMIKT